MPATEEEWESISQSINAATNICKQKQLNQNNEHAVKLFIVINIARCDFYGYLYGINEIFKSFSSINFEEILLFSRV